MRHVLLFRLSCLAVAVLGGVGMGVSLAAVLHHGDPWWYVLAQPMTSALYALVGVALLYWRLGVPGSTIWRVAHRAGFLEGMEEAAARDDDRRVVSLQQRRRSPLN